MSINGISWETGLPAQRKYSTSNGRDRREGTQEDQPEAVVGTQNNGTGWVGRTGKEVKAALLATSYALTSTNM